MLIKQGDGKILDVLDDNKISEIDEEKIKDALKKSKNNKISSNKKEFIISGEN